MNSGGFSWNRDWRFNERSATIEFIELVVEFNPCNFDGMVWPSDARGLEVNYEY
jgi:hypothetical protein